MCGDGGGGFYRKKGGGRSHILFRRQDGRRKVVAIKQAKFLSSWSAFEPLNKAGKKSLQVRTDFFLTSTTMKSFNNQFS